MEDAKPDVLSKHLIESPPGRSARRGANM